MWLAGRIQLWLAARIQLWLTSRIQWWLAARVTLFVGLLDTKLSGGYLGLVQLVGVVVNWNSLAIAAAI